MQPCLASSFRYCSRESAVTQPRENLLSLAVITAVISALVLSLFGFPHAASMPINKGRIYVFRMVRSSGAHLNDVLTIDGVEVQRISPGNGIFCDVTPGEHLLGLAQDKVRPLKVLVEAGQPQYVCVMLQHQKGSSLRSGAISSDQSFKIQLLDPAYGSERLKEYHVTRANCER